jgi:hypothetical protein
MPQMLKRPIVALWRFARAATGSSVAWLVVTCHASAYVLCIANMSPPDRDFADSLDSLYASGGWSSATVFAGRPFHLHYESIPLKVMCLLDLPAVFMSAASASAIQDTLRLWPSVYVQSWLDAGTWLIVASFQWLFLAYWFERLLTSNPRWTRLSGAIRAHRGVLIAAIITATIIAAPLIQSRSNSLGFGHAGMSFGPTR